MSFIVNRALSGSFLSLPYMKPALAIGITASVMSVALRAFNQNFSDELAVVALTSLVAVVGTGAVIDMVLYIGNYHRYESDPGCKLF